MDGKRILVIVLLIIAVVALVLAALGATIGITHLAVWGLAFLAGAVLVDHL